MLCCAAVLSGKELLDQRVAECVTFLPESRRDSPNHACVFPSCQTQVALATEHASKTTNKGNVLGSELNVNIRLWHVF
jgi:hypothetical protein